MSLLPRLNSCKPCRNSANAPSSSSSRQQRRAERSLLFATHSGSLGPSHVSVRLVSLPSVFVSRSDADGNVASRSRRRTYSQQALHRLALARPLPPRHPPHLPAAPVPRFGVYIVYDLVRRTRTHAPLARSASVSPLAPRGAAAAPRQGERRERRGVGGAHGRRGRRMGAMSRLAAHGGVRFGRLVGGAASARMRVQEPLQQVARARTRTCALDQSCVLRAICGLPQSSHVLEAVLSRRDQHSSWPIVVINSCNDVRARATICVRELQLSLLISQYSANP